MTATEATTPLPAIDDKAFAADIDALRAELVADLGPADLAHLQRMERWGRACTLLGYGTAWILPNPLSALLMAAGNVARWTMVTHHVMHRGYDAVPGVPPRFTSRVYARGWRRFLDWPDWMDPAAWDHEHNHLHHYFTGQADDPDLVERNAALLRLKQVPRPLKWLAVLLLMATWKLLYYAPNTLWALSQRGGKRGAPRPECLAFPGERLWLPASAGAAVFHWRCVLPYGLFRFGLLPALFLPLGAEAWLAVLINSLLAEILANGWSFFVIAPNHAGDDLYRFDGPGRGKGEFYLRQIVGSVNYPGGSDRRDFLVGYLNYQIEHHVWPDLPMLKYRQAAPRLKAICQRHGVPYVEEPVTRRFGRLWSIMMGDASMLRAAPRLPSSPGIA